MKYTKSRLRVLCAAFALVFSVCTGIKVYGSEGLSMTVGSRSAILMEPESGKILFEQNPDEKLAPASVTKVMTIYLIYEALEQGRIHLDDIVTVSAHAANMGGSQIFLEPAEKQNVRDLLKSVIIASANDAAVALAEFISGSEESFVDLMNRTADRLGLTDSHFKNACGLDEDGHYMSARDIAIITRELINNYPEVFEYSTTWMDTIVHTTARGSAEFGLTNTNKLVKWYNGATGLKTGSTGKALYCLSGTATRDNLTLIAVVLASPDPTLRFREVMKMFDYGFANYKLVAGDEAGKITGVIRVCKGSSDEVPVKIAKRVSTVAAKAASGSVTSSVTLNEYVDAPVKTGQKLGEITYHYNGAEIGKSDLVAAGNIEKASLGDTSKRLIKDWFK